MPSILDQLRSLHERSVVGYAAPFTYTPQGACILKASGMALEVRGFGHLIGTLRLSEDDAEPVQDAFGQKVALLLNHSAQLLAVGDAARALMGCNSRAPIGANESAEWVAVSVEHLDSLRTTLLALDVESGS